MSIIRSLFGGPSLRAAGALALLAATCSAAYAQQPPEAVRSAVHAFLERETAGLPGAVELTVGQMDTRNQLPACAALEPFLPAGTRAWGRISVGVRCDSPVTWTVYIPAQVAVLTEYLVTARPIRPGQIVSGADLARRRGDLAAQPANTLTDMAQAVGHHARHAVASGNTLRADMLRLPPAVRQGQTVKVTSGGDAGFSVSSEGRALNTAAEGEPVRVRMGNGQVVSGTARNGGTVEVRY
jgi:flagella basal body P-ring formation protein FlgA